MADVVILGLVVLSGLGAATWWAVQRLLREIQRVRAEVMARPLLDDLRHRLSDVEAQLPDSPPRPRRRRGRPLYAIAGPPLDAPAPKLGWLCVLAVASTVGYVALDDRPSDEAASPAPSTATQGDERARVELETTRTPPPTSPPSTVATVPVEASVPADPGHVVTPVESSPPTSPPTTQVAVATTTAPAPTTVVTVPEPEIMSAPPTTTTTEPPRHPHEEREDGLPLLSVVADLLSS